MLINFEKQPSGLMPSRSPEKLPVNNATIASNCYFESSNIKPTKENVLDHTVPEGTKSIYKWKYEVFTISWTGIGSGEMKISIDGVPYAFTTTDSTVQADLRAMTGRFELYDNSESTKVLTCYGFVSDFSWAGISDIEIKNSISTSKWLDYPEFTDIVSSPIINDQYARVYRTTESGDLMIKDLENETKLHIEPPPKIPATDITQTPIIDFNSFRLKWFCGEDAIYQVGDIAPTSVNHQVDGTTVMTFAFAGSQEYTQAEWDAKKDPRLELTLPNGNVMKGILDGSTIIDATPMPIIYNYEETPKANVIGIAGGYADFTETAVPIFQFTPCTITVILDFTIPLPVETAVYYIATFIDNIGQESPPSDPQTNFFLREDKNTILINNIPMSESEDIVKTRIYRSASLESGGVWLKLTDIPKTFVTVTFDSVTDCIHSDIGKNVTGYGELVGFDNSLKRWQFYADTGADVLGGDDLTIEGGTGEGINCSDPFYLYVDNKADTALGLPIANFGNPPVGLTSLCVHPSGSIVGAKNRTIYVSEKFLPFMWSSSYVWSMPSKIQGLEIQGNDIIVLTNGRPQVLGGPEYKYFVREELLINQSCVSPRGYCKIGNDIFYISPDGIIAIQSGLTQNITSEIIDQKFWREFDLKNAMLASYDKKLYMFHSTGGLLYNKGVITTFTDIVTNYYHDIEEDILYVLQGTNVFAWQKGDDNKVLNWKSKHFKFETPQTFMVAQIICSDYTGSLLKIYAGDVLLHTLTISNGNGFRLPIMRPNTKWAFEIECSGEVFEFSIATNMRELC